MHAQKDVDNKPAIEAEEKRWIRRKSSFKTVTPDEILYFPEMSERDLTMFFTASYQLSRAVSYLAEMLNKDGKLTLEYVKEKPNVLKFKVQSRHISQASYRCFIIYKTISLTRSLMQLIVARVKELLANGWFGKEIPITLLY